MEKPFGHSLASARDLTRYVQLELSGGLGPDGKRVISEANLVARRAALPVRRVAAETKGTSTPALSFVRPFTR